MDHDIWLKFMKRGVVLYMLKRYFWAFRLHECSKTASNVKESGLENKVGEGSSDSAILNRRYPRTMRWWHFICKLLAVCKLLDGTYLKSWHDTRLNSGMHIDRLKFWLGEDCFIHKWKSFRSITSWKKSRFGARRLFISAYIGKNFYRWNWYKKDFRNGWRSWK